MQVLCERTELEYVKDHMEEPTARQSMSRTPLENVDQLEGRLLQVHFLDIV